MNQLKLTGTDIDAFAAFPFIHTECMDGLKLELPDYLAAAEDVSDQVDIMEWWKAQEENDAMPHWTRTCKLVLLVQPSSASAKRVFSLLNNNLSRNLHWRTIYSYQSCCSTIINPRMRTVRVMVCVCVCARTRVSVCPSSVFLHNRTAAMVLKRGHLSK